MTSYYDSDSDSDVIPDLEVEVKLSIRGKSRPQRGLCLGGQIIQSHRSYRGGGGKTQRVLKQAQNPAFCVGLRAERICQDKIKCQNLKVSESESVRI